MTTRVCLATTRGGADPTVEKLARELNSRLRVAKIKVDENPMIPARFGIQSVTTMMTIKNGQVADRWLRAQPEPAIRGRVVQSRGGQLAGRGCENRVQARSHCPSG